MLTSVDLLTFAFLAFAVWDGWRAGLLRSLLNPLCLAIFVPIGIINYDLNKNFAVSALTIVLGGLAVANVIRAILLLTRRTVDKEFRRYVFWGSRLAGGAVSALWKGLLFSIVLLFMTLLPSRLSPGGEGLQKAILRSQTFFFIDQKLLSLSPNFRNVYFLFNVLKNPISVKRYADTPEYHAFFDSQKVKDFVADDSVQSLLAGQHFFLLLRHPRVINLLKDNQLMYSLGLLAQKLYNENFQLTR